MDELSDDVKMALLRVEVHRFASFIFGLKYHNAQHRGVFLKLTVHILSALYRFANGRTRREKIRGKTRNMRTQSQNQLQKQLQNQCFQR
jgi:hypothetical protein